MTALSVLQEKLYTVPDAMDILGIGRAAIVSLFRDEPGVIVYGTKENKKRIGAAGETRERKYCNIRIPQSVLNRVAARFINGEPPHAKLVRRKRG